MRRVGLSFYISDELPGLLLLIVDMLCMAKVKLSFHPLKMSESSTPLIPRLSTPLWSLRRSIFYFLYSVRPQTRYPYLAMPHVPVLSFILCSPNYYFM